MSFKAPIFITVAALLSLGLIGGAVYMSLKQSEPGPRQTTISEEAIERVKSGFWKRGEGPTVIEEFSDFQCPYCSQLNAAFQQLPNETSNSYTVQFRQYPLTTKHNKALQAAIAAEAAGRQGKFWQMHDLLFSRQTQWQEETSYAFTDILERYAGELSINLNDFRRDARDPAVAKLVQDDVLLGDTRKITGTPSLFVNGKKLENLTFDPTQLAESIRSAAR